jgi:hypothetical protein
VSEPHSDSHWGGERLRVGLFVVLGTVALMAGLIALFHWSPWKGPSELDWLQTYEAWSERTEGTLAADGGVTRAACEATFDDEVGDPPKDRLERAARAARRGCAALSPDGWQRAQSDVVRAIRDAHVEEAPAPPRERQDFSELARPIAGVDAKVYCWRDVGWAPFVEQYAAVRADEVISLKGLADTEENRIDLEPAVCAVLGRYVRRIRPLHLSYENFALAEALVVLAHEAERLESPSASEAELECQAVQHVRPFIRAAGWGPSFAEEIALHAWDLGYTQLPPHYRTPQCRNRGPLDRHPNSDAWP